MAAKKPDKMPAMIKVVYFDQDAASDYLDIANGGQMDLTEERQKEKMAQAMAQVEAEIGGGMSLFSFLKASFAGNTSAKLDSEVKSIISSKITNTILTDYIQLASKDDNIGKFPQCIVYALKESMSNYKMYSPYMVLYPENDMPIDIKKLNEALENARGYYELLIAGENPSKSVLRFNASAFRNNYNLSDLTKMQLSYYAVKVGTCTIDNLNMKNEFDVNKTVPTVRDYTQEATELDKDLLDVYDVILAGVEIDE